MSKNVVLWNGKVVTVDDDTAAQIERSGSTSNHEESAGEAANAARATNEGDLHSNSAGGGINSIGDVLTGGLIDDISGRESGDQAREGFADTLSFGGYGKAKDALNDEDTVASDRIARQAHGTARAIGSIGAIAVNPGGVVGDAGLAAKGAEAVGLGTTAGRALEGAALGVGSHISESNVTGDPLTIEGTLQAAGTGALLNAGAGALGDKLFWGAGKAQVAQAEAKTVADDIGVAAKGQALFKEPPASWQEVREAHQASIDTITENNKAFDKAQKAYDDFVGSKGSLNDTISDFEKAHKQLAAEIKNGADVGVTQPDQFAPLGSPGAATAAEAGDPLQGVMKAPARTPYDAMTDLRRATDRAKLMVRQGDREGAAALLRETKASIEGQVNIKLPELPQAPEAMGLSRQAEIEAELPKTLKEFARQRPETIAKIANTMDSDTATAFQKLAGDIGVDANDGVAGIQAKLKNYNWTINDISAKEAAVKAAKEGADDSQGVVGWLGTQAKKAAKYTAARAADVGGPLGAFTRTIGGEAAGATLNKVEDAMLGSTLIEGKAGLKASIGNTLAKYGVPTGKALTKLGPVTSILASQFPSGKPDPEPDMRQQANNRMKDFIAAQQSAPDSLFNLLTPMMGHPADLAYKFHSAMMNQLSYLVGAGPKDPGTDHTMFKSNWLPTHEDAIAFAHRIEAITNPMVAIIRSIAGGGHPAAAEALQSGWPATMSEFASQVCFAEPILKGLNHTTTAGYSQLLGVAASPLQDPEVMAMLQGLYLPRPQQGQSQMASSAPSPRPAGRPAAVQSPVAGSSVASLIS